MSCRAASFDDAVHTILERIVPTEAEEIPLTDSLGRTLGRHVVAETDLPPWDNSAMDGYACRAADIAGASGSAAVQLPVAETIAAGNVASRPLRVGEAMRIMTGAPIPEGADTVVRVEDTDGGTTVVAVRSIRDAHGNIRRKGEDIRSGDTALTAGHRIGAAELAMLAALGNARVTVHRKPRVAILCSGDELAPVEDTLALRSRSRVISANSYSLAALVAEAGGDPVDLGIVPDDPRAIVAGFERARGCDLLLTSGGISVGGFDYTRAAIEAAGGKVLFWRVPIRPGYNSGFGAVHGAPWLGVPGNPVSAIIAGEVLARPAIRRLCGSATPLRACRKVTVDERVRGGRGVTLFVRVVLENCQGDLPVARPAGPQGSAVLSTSVRATALLIVPSELESVEPGTRLDALILREDVAFAPS